MAMGASLALFAYAATLASSAPPKGRLIRCTVPGSTPMALEATRMTPDIEKHLAQEVLGKRLIAPQPQLLAKHHAVETGLPGWACKTRTQKCRRKLSL